MGNRLILWGLIALLVLIGLSFLETWWGNHRREVIGGLLILGIYYHTLGKR